MILEILEHCMKKSKKTFVVMSVSVIMVKSVGGNYSPSNNRCDKTFPTDFISIPYLLHLAHLCLCEG